MNKDTKIHIKTGNKRFKESVKNLIPLRDFFLLNQKFMTKVFHKTTWHHFCMIHIKSSEFCFIFIISQIFVSNISINQMVVQSSTENFLWCLLQQKKNETIKIIKNLLLNDGVVFFSKCR